MFLQPARAGSEGTMLNNIMSRLRGLNKQEMDALINGTPLEKFLTLNHYL